MKILIIRHGDPDYEHDSLTEKGWKEAEMLSEKMVDIHADAYYVSPLGRAKDTASLTLKKLGKEATELDWLREFPARINRPDRTDRQSIAWDWLPADWTADERFFSKDHWFENERMVEGNVKEQYDHVTSELDLLLAKHGYIRDGHLYKAVNANNGTIVFFCHFGLEAVLLSHLLNVSPMILWHGFCAAPSSVTTLVTEERRKGTAYFRALSFGDTSHLYVHGEKPAFSARFVEKYGNIGERVD